MSKDDIEPLQSLVKLYYPNWRKALHNLQRITTGGVIDGSLITKIKDEHISTLFDLMKAKNFTKVREWVAESLASGVSATAVVNIIYKEAKQFIKPPSLPQCVLILADYQQKAAVVANQEVNTVAMATELMMQCEFQ